MKTNMRLTLLVLFTITSFKIFAQSEISGKIVDNNTAEAIEFVNIRVCKTDSTLIAGCYSDVDGLFKLQNISADDYYISASYVGYKDTTIVVHVDNRSTELGHIHLKSVDKTLSTVTVTGNSVIKKLDRDLVVPSEMQVKVSTDGLSLLQNMQLPGISVDPINRKITAMGGGNVQIRINGIESEISDLSGISPDDIIRIEYHQNPSLRYGNVDAVVNFIVKRREYGGNVNANLMNNFSDIGSTGFWEDNIAAKVNHKKSEFSINTNLWHRKIKWVNENIEWYKYQDKTVERREEGQPTQVETTTLQTKLNYSLVENDKYFFNIAFRLNRKDTPHDFSNRISLIYESDETKPLEIKDQTKILNNTPSLDLYYERNLKNNQLLIFNVVGTYIDTESTRIYQESKNQTMFTNVLSEIKGNKYSLMAEGIYEKQLSTSKIAGGLRYAQSYTENKYRGTTIADVAMNTSDLYGYAQFQSKIQKLSYSFGFGISRNYHSQIEIKKASYIFRPTVNLGYNFDRNAYIKLNSYMANRTPSLSDLNNVDQVIDALQIRRGNPNLKTTWSMSTNFNIGYKYKWISADYSINHQYDHKPIMSEVLLEDNTFVQTVNNQKSFQRIYSNLNIKIQPWQEYISLSIAPGFNYYRSHGNNYLHNHTNWYLTSNLNATYKNIVFNASGSTNYHWLTGEELYYGENYHWISAGYKRAQWSLMAGAFNLFSSQYKNDSKNLSKLTPKESYVSSKNISPIFLIQFTCNINFGRKFDSTQKRINREDNDSGVLGGRK